MVINDLDVERITLVPAEAHAPLVVDTDPVLSGTITAQPLEAIAWRDAKIVEDGGRVELHELPQSDPE